MNDTKTLVIDNFRGMYTIYQFGDINSGRSYEQVSGSQNPFVKPGQLTWSEQATLIDPNGSVITDMILAGKERVESGILYVYAIGHTGRLYKIQVNDPNTYNPDYDNPVLLATLTVNSPTFTRGGSLDFFGSTERVYIGHDKGLTRIDFNGTNETFVGSMGSWTQTVPRPLQQFVGKLYIGNGTNLAEVDSTATITTYTKLSPGFPDSTQVRDIDVSPDGNYMETVVSRLPLYDITSTAQETTSTANSDSYIFKWNGSDIGYTSFTSFPSFALSANKMFQNYQYTFGTDQFGAAIYNPSEKVMSIPEIPSPLPNAIISTGNLLMWISPLRFYGVLEADIMCWGSMDFEVGNPLGYWDINFINAQAPETDIIRVPFMLSASNTGFGSSFNNYPNNLFGTSKIYFSTLETSSAPTTKYRLYKVNFITSAQQVSQSATILGLYQTQIQMFSKKMTVSEVRVYGEPWVAGNSFSIDLMGSGGFLTPITNGSYTFTAGTNLTIGDDFAWYNPNIAPTYALGVLISNLGGVNHTINKIEIDISPAGK